MRFALWAFSVDKLKASLTMLGVMIGSAAIVLVVTIASTGKTYILDLIQGIGSNLTYASLDRNGAPTLPEDEITPRDLLAIQDTIPNVTSAAGSYDVPITFELHGKSVNARLVGVSEEFQSIRHLRITSGRYFDSEDFSSRAKACLITDKVAQLVFGSESPIGAPLHIDQFECKVIGTFTEGVPTFGQSEIQSETVLVPFPLIRVVTGDRFFQVVYAQAASAGDVDEITEAMSRLLHSRHRPEARYSVQNLSSILQTAHSASMAMTLVLVLVALLTLVVAGTGIMNIMLVNVAQRTREIGVRKAVGARPSEIRMQFLMEALFISLFGALAGVLIALTLAWSVSQWVEGVEALSIPWIGIVAAMALSCGIGVLFGYSPASRAARLDPVHALRAE